MAEGRYCPASRRGGHRSGCVVRRSDTMTNLSPSTSVLGCQPALHRHVIQKLYNLGDWQLKRNAWSYTSTPIYSFIACTEENYIYIQGYSKWLSQYTWDRSIYVFYLIEQHSKFLLHTLQVLYICTLCGSTGLFEMIVGVLTTCHTQYTWDRSICVFLFNRTTLQVFVTCLTGALYVHPLWFYKHQHDNRVRSKLFVACQRW